MTSTAQETDTQPQRYDTSRDMRTIRTKQGPIAYLGVKGRVAWLRAEHPDAEIVTEKVDGGVEAGWVEFRCTIRVPNGGCATGYASETHQDFPDFYEKGETKAIGRACALLGYGTEGARDLDDGEPLDGAAASKDERAARRMEPHERQQVDAQHERNVAPQPRPSSLPVTRTHAGSGPDGADRTRASIEEKCAAKGIPVLPIDTYEVIAETVNRALMAAGKDIEVKTDGQGRVAPGAILNALLALPSAVPA